MMVEYPTVVKFLTDEDGHKDDRDVWHMSTISCGDPCSLCEGQHYGYGQGYIKEEGKHYLIKEGKITCETCRDIIKTHKKVKL